MIYVIEVSYVVLSSLEFNDWSIGLLVLCTFSFSRNEKLNLLFQFVVSVGIV